MGGVSSVGGLSKGSQPVFKRVSEKTTENSERLDRQAWPGIEPGTSRLPVQNRSVIGVAKDRQFDIRALPGVRKGKHEYVKWLQ